MILGGAQGPADISDPAVVPDVLPEGKSQSLKSLRHVCVSESFLPGL